VSYEEEDTCACTHMSHVCVCTDTCVCCVFVVCAFPYDSMTGKDLSQGAHVSSSSYDTCVLLLI
jgi:hypothetical protein